MTQATRKTVSKKANAKGVVFALVTDGTTWEVWKLCENYNGQARGCNAKQKRYVEKGMTEKKKKKLFEKHL